MPRFTELLERVDHWLYAAIKAIAATAVFAMIVTTFIDVLGRHFASAIPGASEIISIQLAVAFFAGMSLVFREKAHIVVGLLVPRYPEGLQFVEKLFSNLISVAAMGLITWLMLTKGQKLAEAQTLTGYLDLPLAWIAYLLGVLALAATYFALRGPEEEDGES